MSSVFFWPSAIVAVLFLGAAVLKLSRPRLFVSELRDYQLLPAVLVGPVAAAVIALELAGGVLALTPQYHQIGCACLLGLLIAFTAAVVRVLLSGRRNLSCACFGSASKTLDWSIPLRNLFLSVAVASGIFVEPTSLTAASASTTLLSAALAFLCLQAAQMFEAASEKADV
jgi:hypothetical protein